MREFRDDQGRGWIAYVRRESGPDYKGRYHLLMSPQGVDDGELSLDEVRWNTEYTARRTLATMSTVELRRRLRGALGRSALPANLG